MSHSEWRNADVSGKECILCGVTRAEKTTTISPKFSRMHMQQRQNVRSRSRFSGTKASLHRSPAHLRTNLVCVLFPSISFRTSSYSRQQTIRLLFGNTHTSGITTVTDSTTVFLTTTKMLPPKDTSLFLPYWWTCTLSYIDFTENKPKQNQSFMYTVELP